MKNMKQIAVMHVAAIVSIGCLSGISNADLSLIINTLTADELSFTISGTFDEDVGGDEYPRYLAIKNDWSNNVGINVDWINNAVGNNSLSNLPGRTDVENTIAFNGSAPTESHLFAIDLAERGDSIQFTAPFDITAGTVVSGTLTIVGAGFFDPTADRLQLVSGISVATQDYARFEANANSVPEPGSATLFGLGSIAILASRRQSKSRRA